MCKVKTNLSARTVKNLERVTATARLEAVKGKANMGGIGIAEVYRAPLRVPHLK